METSLDEISLGSINYKEYLKEFYFGETNKGGLEKQLNQEFNKQQSRLIKLFKQDDLEIELRIGRYGIYAEKDDERTTIGSDLNPSDVTYNILNNLFLNKSKGNLELCKHPKSGESIYLKTGKFQTDYIILTSSNFLVKFELRE